jgi:hypothetical protein
MSGGTDPDDDIAAEDKRICADCIGDDYLTAGVEKNGVVSRNWSDVI